MGLDIFENEEASEKVCAEIEDWAFSVLGFQENSIYTKIYTEVMCNDTEKWWKIWRGIDLSFRNWHEKFDKFWLESWKFSKIYALTCCFWPKYLIPEPKKYGGVMFDGTEYWCKINKFRTTVWACK